jgi:hypothetical protein
MMSIRGKRVFTFILAVSGLLLVLAVTGTVADSHAQETAYPSLEVGQPGPKAVDLRVWAERAPGDLAKAGVPAVVRVKSSDKAYLAAIYVAPDRDAIVLLPNRNVPNSVILPEQDYVLFGQDAQVQLKQTDMAKDAKIIFYVSSVPLPVADLSISPGETFARINQSSGEHAKALRKSLEVLAQDPAFNRKVLALKGEDKKGLRLELMDLPPDVTSSKPIGVTGAPGLKEKSSESGKE